jgi:hypothetical protein
MDRSWLKAKLILNKINLLVAYRSLWRHQVVPGVVTAKTTLFVPLKVLSNRIHTSEIFI